MPSRTVGDAGLPDPGPYGRAGCPAGGNRTGGAWLQGPARACRRSRMAASSRSYCNVDRPSSASLQACSRANRMRLSVRSNSGRCLASSRRPRIIAMICSPEPQAGQANTCSCACVILPDRESLQIQGGNCRGWVTACTLIAAPVSPFPERNVFISRGISGVHFNEILPLQVLNGEPFNLMAIDL